ncbi:unnamed protein product [Linum trigynum]|uniref:Uncharacterized protein n=1 Tax=Linum trigynum TaxID=586398 RepID=A0AAV2FQ53_9ROSI
MIWDVSSSVLLGGKHSSRNACERVYHMLDVFDGFSSSQTLAVNEKDKSLKCRASSSPPGSERQILRKFLVCNTRSSSFSLEKCFISNFLYHSN